MSNSGVITRQPYSTDSMSAVPKAKSSEKVNESNNRSNLVSTDEENPVDVMKDISTVIVELFTAVRYGQHTLARKILENHNEMLKKDEKYNGGEMISDAYDKDGYTCAHWAAKKGDIQMLQLLLEFKSTLSEPTRNESKMLPIHWGASDGRIETLRFLHENVPHIKVQSGNTRMIDVQDSNGYTPVHIATQYMHPACVLYCIKVGCDMDIKDNNGDVAMHWAAYKGHSEIVGLLSHYTPYAVELYDSYGQTPLHLSALRGHYDVVEYLLINCHADPLKKDNNGQIPLDIAINKQHFKCEWCLRKFMFSKDMVGFVKNLGGIFSILRNSRTMQVLIFGYNDKEISKWPWLVVLISNVLAAITTTYFATHIAMNDLYWLHLFNCIVVMSWFFNFFMCGIQNPGECVDNIRNSASKSQGKGDIEMERLLDDAEKGKQSDVVDYSFEAAANAISKTISSHTVHEENMPSVCYTCKLRKPLRSKHCKVQRCCIHKFDHFCPFVGNTIGRDNYKYFLGLLVTHGIGASVWVVTAIIFILRVKTSWLFIFFIGYSIMWLFAIFGLLGYHVQLVLSNLTTNEHMNYSRYKHMRDSHGNLNNPFNRKSVMLNVLDALFPSKASYYSREEVVMAISGSRSA